MDLFSTLPTHYSLHDLTLLVAGQLEVPALQGVWVVGEISDFSIRRHCYMTLIEKDDAGETVAQLRANIWANVLYRLKAKFENATGQPLANGLKVLLHGAVTYHPVYGIAFNIVDIDPSYTLGDKERIRQEILRRLASEGLLERNRQCPLPLNPQRIAVISSATAAGYRDFCHQLAENSSSIKFYTCLFPASMQGQETVSSVLSALQRVEQCADLFDCVAIIRGGGSENDLSWFDNYDLARKVALFPLPILTGIGHQHNVGVLDSVAAFPVKTPTAVADWLINACESQLNGLSSMAQRVVALAQSRIADERLWLQGRVPHILRTVLRRLYQEKLQMVRALSRVSSAARLSLQREGLQLDALAKQVFSLSPQSVLQRGYSFTTVAGKSLSSIGSLSPGDVITTHLADGLLTSEITNITQQPKN